jgi:hypothetical protein
MYNFSSSPNIRIIQSQTYRKKRTQSVAHLEEMKISYRILASKPEWKWPLGKT